MLDAVFLTPGQTRLTDLYYLLVAASLLLVISFAALFAAAWLGQHSMWRTWGILLGVTLAITAIGLFSHTLARSNIPGPTPQAPLQEMAPEEPTLEVTPEEPTPEEAAPEVPTSEGQPEILSFLRLAKLRDGAASGTLHLR